MTETSFDSVETKLLALGHALGKDDVYLLELIQNEGLYGAFEKLLSIRQSLYMEDGTWMQDYIDLRAAVEAVEICKYNPKEQKKAYNALVVFLKAQSFSPWGHVVHDKAFGDLRLFEEDDDDNDNTR